PHNCNPRLIARGTSKNAGAGSLAVLRRLGMTKPRQSNGCSPAESLVRIHQVSEFTGTRTIAKKVSGRCRVRCLSAKMESY
ncbi:MAG TPA: hypothetical protein VFV83_00540, partial [Chthoniobacteraceae bacterium]|nr:hypothetical protein [Chthoniobacteraceae bacterium]